MKVWGPQGWTRHRLEELEVPDIECGLSKGKEDFFT